jgi:hypothetical protein
MVPTTIATANAKIVTKCVIGDGAACLRLAATLALVL